MEFLYCCLCSTKVYQLVLHTNILLCCTLSLFTNQTRNKKNCVVLYLKTLGIKLTLDVLIRIHNFIYINFFIWFKGRYLDMWHNLNDKQVPWFKHMDLDLNTRSLSIGDSKVWNYQSRQNLLCCLMCNGKKILP